MTISNLHVNFDRFHLHSTWMFQKTGQKRWQLLIKHDQWYYVDVVTLRVNRHPICFVSSIRDLCSIIAHRSLQGKCLRELLGSLSMRVELTCILFWFRTFHFLFLVYFLENTLSFHLSIPLLFSQSPQVFVRPTSAFNKLQLNLVQSSCHSLP